MRERTPERVRLLATTLALFALSSLMLAALGVGTAGFGLWIRASEVAFVCFGGFAVGAAVSQGLRRLAWPGERRWAETVCMSVLMIAPSTLLSWSAEWALLQLGEPFANLPAHLRIWAVLSPIVCCSMALVAGVWPRPPRATPPPVEGARPAFMNRLPPKLRGAELWAVEAEDHYLRVHTSRGGALILMRLADALAELEAVDGARIHRSWWVARAAVADARRIGKRALLDLPDGAQAPVSRSYVAALRRAGWF